MELWATTTLPPVARSTDPRHGIWILPLVIVGMVGSTAVFVNSLNPGTVPDGTGPGATAPLDTTETTVVVTLPEETTTTTLPEQEAQYLAAMEALRSQSATLVESAVTINAGWDDRSISFQQALEQLRELRTQTETFAAEVEGATPTNLPLLEPAHLEAVTWAKAMVSAADAMVVGLQDPNSSEGRRVALEEYQASGGEFSGSIDVIGAVARGEDPSTVGAGEGATETTANPDEENLDITGEEGGIDE